MALAMSNEPITFIVSTTSFKGNVMADIPLLAWDYFHAAQVTYSIMPQKDVGSHFRSYADTLDQ
jgi:hypothetical protein